MRNTALALMNLSALLSAGCASSPSGTSPLGAEGSRGFYAKAFAGYGTLEDAEVNVLQGGSASAETEGAFDPGPLFGAAAGYDFDERWSMELEFAYRSNDLDGAASGSTVVATEGDFASTSLMLNGFYRFDTDWTVRPYVGLGFGLATEIDIDLAGGNAGAGGSYSTESPAAQFMLGATKPLTSGIDAFVEGRFYRAFDPEMGSEGGSSNGGLRIESEYGHSALLFGAKFRL